MTRFVQPDAKRLELSDGDWVLVKKRLTAGESREQLRGSYTADAAGQLHFDHLNSGRAMLIAYLLDWSLTDGNAKPVVIRDQPPSVIASMLDNLDPDDFAELKAAVEKHENDMDRERAEEKKRRGTPALIST